MLRIVFVVGRGGGGHKASARAVRDALPPHLRNAVEFLDMGYAAEACLWGKESIRSSGFDADELYNTCLKKGFFFLAALLGFGAKLVAKLGRSRIVNGLARMWSKSPPHLVVSFVPYFNAIMRESLHDTCPDASLVTVVTDFANSPEHQWLDPYDRQSRTRHVVVAGTPTLIRQCQELGYPSKDVLASSGMVVHPCFHAQSLKETGGPESPLRVPDRALISFGAMPPMRVEAIAVALARSQPQLEVVVLCGGNAELLRRLRARGDLVVAMPMVDAEAMREFMRTSAFVVGKPGPGTVSEAVACGTAFVTERKGVMAQEKDVLCHVEQVGAGVVVDSLTDMPADLWERVQACQPTMRSLAASNRAVFEVRDLVLSLLHAMPLNSQCEEEGHAAETMSTSRCAPQRGG